MPRSAPEGQGAGARRDLRARAEGQAAALPALILAAERLASALPAGAHGQRQAGMGEDFWQYRPAHTGDALPSIDWRRSARSDARFVRERERMSLQSAQIWVANGAAMNYGSARANRRDEAQLIALALGVLLLRGGERVGLLDAPPRAGRGQIARLAEGLHAPARSSSTDYDSPDPAHLRAGSQIVLIGDFLGDLDGLSAFIARAAALNCRGALLQILHPDEEGFPFDGAMRFRAPSGAISHDTRDAAGLRAAYQARLAERKADLRALAAGAGWSASSHDCARPAAEALIWLHQVLGGR